MKFMRLAASFLLSPSGKVDEDIWVSSISLDWSHRDPADRVIVATATQRDIPIVSKDTIIRDFYLNVIW